MVFCAQFTLSTVAFALLGMLIALDASDVEPEQKEPFLTRQPALHYLSNTEVEALFSRLQHDHPLLARSYSIGETLEKRDMHALALTATMPDPKDNRLRPLVKVTANLRGDETLGRQIILFMAEYLLVNYETLPEVQQLLNTTEIHFLPSCNPDGFARAKEGNCESLPDYIGRTNAAGIDLNRDFPDRLESQHTIQLRSQSRQPETAALVEWILSKPFVLSANFHGGAVVTSYPYDNSIAHHESCVESLTPDDRIFKLMAHTYADNHPIMRKGNNCNETFANGVTNGAHWYELNGGMQDFNYAFSNCFELTIELSCCKYPPAETLPTEWARNKRSLLQLLKMAHVGVKGLVKDVGGYPVHDAVIVVSGLEDKPIRTTRLGEYWRLLTPGIYNVQAVAFGFQSSEQQQIHVTNENNEALRLDFVLKPIETNYDGAFRKLKVTREEPTEDKYGFVTSTEFEHHNYTSMEKYLRDITTTYPTITRLYTIGKSVEQRDLWVMEITANPGVHIPGIPEFKYVANMHGNEVVGKEMLLLLTKYLCEQYLVNARITQLINSTRMHFLYSMNPDGYETSTEGDKRSALGRSNAHNVDLNRNFPDQYGSDQYNTITEPEVAAVMNWTLSLPFVLSANLHGGSLVANYPFDDNPNDFNDPMTRLRLSTLKGRKLNPTDDNELFRHLAAVYATAHPTMHLGKSCPFFKNETFEHGITNGAQWYSVTGGMQDWNYVRASVMELTIEMGCDKFPLRAELPQYWLDNREALLLYIEQIHYGVYGFIKSSIGTPVVGAMITLDGARHATYSYTYGDYWKLALPGRHNITIQADSFTPQRDEIEIPKDGKRSIRRDVTMMHDDPQHWASAYDFRIIKNVVNTRYHNNVELRQELAEFETQNGQVAAFGYAESEFGVYYSFIKMTADIGEPEESKLKILILSSLFDATSPLAREITLNLARHVINGYKQREPPILDLLKRSVLHFLPITENFDVVYNMFQRNNSVCDPVIGDELADRILSPETEKRRDLFLQYLDSERFDLMLTFTAGNSELSYPKNDKLLQKFAHKIEKTEFSFSPLQCSHTSTRTLQHEETERLLNFFYKIYNIPMFSLGLSCCRMPSQSAIATVWRKNLEKIKNFLQLIDTGVVGRVHDNKAQPLREAFIRLIDHGTVYNVTKNAARFQIILTEGVYALEISAPNFETRVEKVTITHGQIYKMGVIKLNPYTLVTGKSEIRQLGNATLFPSTVTISGFVLDTGNHPISNAKVSVVAPHTAHYLRSFTDSMGTYSISNIPAGEITLEVEAPRHHSATRQMHMIMGDVPVPAVVFRLQLDEHVFGMPRLLFIILASIAIIVGVVICIVCVQFVNAQYQRQRSGDRWYYNFSVLPQPSKELFEDDAVDDDETELFRSPIKKGMSIQPYYDEENAAQISETDNEEFVYDSGEEIIMLEKRTSH